MNRNVGVTPPINLIERTCFQGSARSFYGIFILILNFYKRVPMFLALLTCHCETKVVVGILSDGKVHCMSTELTHYCLCFLLIYAACTVRNSVGHFAVHIAR